MHGGDLRERMDALPDRNGDDPETFEDCRRCRRTDRSTASPRFARDAATTVSGRIRTLRAQWAGSAHRAFAFPAACSGPMTERLPGRSDGRAVQGPDLTALPASGSRLAGRR
ncbi:hypothetical protein FOHLNKBM_5238 [Methylobacterium longum]|nr:hypothetical protein FOHLNKBM_5238 [Methylobacterium longum]